MTFEEAKLKAQELQGGEAVERPVEEYAGFQFGQRVRLVDDEGFLQAGEEGFLVLQEVGDPKYGNVRIDIGVILDGSDCPESIDETNLEVVA